MSDVIIVLFPTLSVGKRVEVQARIKGPQLYAHHPPPAQSVHPYASCERDVVLSCRQQIGGRSRKWTGMSRQLHVIVNSVGLSVHLVPDYFSLLPVAGIDPSLRSFFQPWSANFALRF